MLCFHNKKEKDMELLLWRHAEAEDGEDDLARPLTQRGCGQAARMAAWIKAHQPKDLRIIVSHALRTQQTVKALDLPYETFRRKFRRDNGITLHQFIADRLIQRASLGLLLTKDTVQQIAAQLGFADEFYFSRFFKQKMEYSPREYRRINAVLRH